MLPDKRTVLHALRAQLAKELEAVERVAAMARDEVGSDETRAEGRYDTRSTEASYLARGQAWRVAELRQLAAWFRNLDPEGAPPPDIQVGALVALEGHREQVLFLAPIGGLRAEVEGRVVRVISPVSPLGRGLTGLEVGDEAEIDSPQGRVTYEVVGLA